jgi:hypothetical protein
VAHQRNWVVLMAGILNANAAQSFFPGSLFASNEQGVWYDPSDMATLFQDAAGTTPVTAVEQPVGLILDKSGRGNHATQSTSTARPVLSARINLLANTDTLATQSVTTVATNYTLRFEGAGSITLSGTATGTFSAGTHTVTSTAGTLTLTVSGAVNNADLRVANDGVGLPVYQRIVTGTDYDTVGFPRYLRFDGTDDSLVTGTITPGVDKAQVFAGVRKLGAAGTLRIFAEHSASRTSNNGAWTIVAPGFGSEQYGFNSKGSVDAQCGTTSASFAAPISNILTGLGDIAGDSVTLRLNGAQITQTTTDQGSGNYLAYPLYIGRRGGTSNPFNGRLYSLAVRFGANLTEAQIAQTETWVNSKTRAY